MIDFKSIANELGITQHQVQKTINLLNEGATIPFISRYRKEETGELDEVIIASIKNLKNKQEEFINRKEAIIDSIKKQDKWTSDIERLIANCNNISELEDVYLPFKQKRKTKASIARENGLEPLALFILRQTNESTHVKARLFLNTSITSIELALEGARHIIAELINENIHVRTQIRNIFNREAIITSKLIKSKEAEALKFKDYFNSTEQLIKCPSHRFLAIIRGGNEGFLRVNIKLQNEEKAIDCIEKIYFKSRGESWEQIKLAIVDSYDRLISPSLENEFLQTAKEKADKEAIRVFADNLKQLLLAPPLGQKRILALDPGFKSGCKLVCLDQQGTLIHNETIYPHPPQSQTKQAAAKIMQLCETYKIEAIAIGNGTAGRETEFFIQRLHFNLPIQVYVVNEQGASIYSASSIARAEFPEYDVTVRGAVSIGRRLMDPLAELVKIDPKSIGVGQYQHDVDQHLLKAELDTVVESAVNTVGVNLNTASKYLLNYVSGIGETIAENIVQYRKVNGEFKSRLELKKVARLGEKSFEQCAGFLRIKDGENPLDNTAVHPERYELVSRMAKDLGCTIPELITDSEKRNSIDLKKYITDEIGLPTLQDILHELTKPGLDPRSKIKIFEFAKGITKPEHLQLGMKVPGIVTNITKFGAFVDIGVKQDGLIHLSNLANRFVSDASEIVKLNQQVQVKIIDLDLPRKRIGLSLKEE